MVYPTRKSLPAIISSSRRSSGTTRRFTASWGHSNRHEAVEKARAFNLQVIRRTTFPGRPLPLSDAPPNCTKSANSCVIPTSGCSPLDRNYGLQMINHALADAVNEPKLQIRILTTLTHSYLENNERAPAWCRLCAVFDRSWNRLTDVEQRRSNSGSVTAGGSTGCARDG